MLKAVTNCHVSVQKPHLRKIGPSSISDKRLNEQWIPVKSRNHVFFAEGQDQVIIDGWSFGQPHSRKVVPDLLLNILKHLGLLGIRGKRTVKALKVDTLMRDAMLIEGVVQPNYFN